MAMNPQHIQEARGFHQKGDFARAIAMYEEALRDDPRLAEVWQLKGMAEHQSGRLHDARQSAAIRSVSLVAVIRGGPGVCENAGHVIVRPAAPVNRA